MNSSPFPYADYPRQGEPTSSTIPMHPEQSAASLLLAQHNDHGDQVVNVPNGTVFVRSLPGRHPSSQSQQESYNQVVCQPQRCQHICPQLCLRFLHPWNQRWLLWLCCQVSHYRQLWCVNEGCGIVCAGVTWSLILFAETVVLSVILGPVPSNVFRLYNGILFHLLIVLACISHLKAVFTDPGSMPLNSATPDNVAMLNLADGQVIYRCPKCDCIKPSRAHHCSVCRRCIRKMDHHCPWVNNCVGEGNQKYFILFTMYICLASAHAMYMGAHFLFMCIRSEWEECSGAPDRLMGLWSAPSPGVATLLLAFLIAESLIFGLFTFVMFSSQLYAVCSDTTAIEQLKEQQKKGAQWHKQSKWSTLERTFGARLSWRWFSPFTPPMPPLDWYGSARQMNVV